MYIGPPSQRARICGGNVTGRGKVRVRRPTVPPSVPTHAAEDIPVNDGSGGCTREKQTGGRRFGRVRGGRGRAGRPGRPRGGRGHGHGRGGGSGCGQPAANKDESQWEWEEVPNGSLVELNNFPF